MLTLLRQPILPAHCAATSRRETRAILFLAGPLAVIELGTVGMTIVDTVIVGRLGAGALAALGYASAIQFVVLGLLAGTLAGVTPLIARAHGTGDTRRVVRLAAAALWLAALLGLPGTAAFWFGGTVARLTGQSAIVSGSASTYLRVLALGVPATLLFVAGRAVLDGVQRPRAASMITVVGVAVGALVAVLLVPRYGLVGAAMATSAVRWLMAAAMLVQLRRERLIGAGPQNHLPSDAAKIARLGVPIGIHTALELAVFATAATFAGWLGVATLAAWQVAMNAVQTAFVLALALGSAGAIRLGHALGAGDRDRALHVARATFRITIGVASACGLVFAAAPQRVAHLYTTDPTVLAIAAPMFAVAALFTVADELQVCAITLLHGAADTVAAATIGLFGYLVVGLPLAWWLGFHAGWGASGLWAGLGGGMMMVGVVSAMRLHWRLGTRVDGGQLRRWDRDIPLPS